MFINLAVGMVPSSSNNINENMSIRGLRECRLVKTFSLKRNPTNT